MAPLPQPHAWHERLFAAFSPRELCVVGSALLFVQFAKALLTFSPKENDFAIFYTSALRGRDHLPMYVLDGSPFRELQPAASPSHPAAIHRAARLA